MKKFSLIKLAVSLMVCLLAGAVGSFFTFASIPTWYAGLKKPFFSPPNWLFGPVWTILYIMMAVAAYLIWQKGLANSKVQTGLELFAIQLVLNLCWSIIFFGLRAPLFAFVEIVTLWLVILFTIQKFSQISATAGWLLVPYLAWVSFASILNFSIFLLNR